MIFALNCRNSKDLLICHILLNIPFEVLLMLIMLPFGRQSLLLLGRLVITIILVSPLPLLHHHCYSFRTERAIEKL
jgi:hypothetical protein